MGNFSRQPKIAKIIPLYKKKGNMVFERVIFNQLYNMYLDHNNNMNFARIILQSWQLLNWSTIIVHEIDRKLTPVNIYIDLSKPFDTLNFDILFYKLHYYGITDIALNLL